MSPWNGNVPLQPCRDTALAMCVSRPEELGICSPDGLTHEPSIADLDSASVTASGYHSPPRRKGCQGFICVSLAHREIMPKTILIGTGALQSGLENRGIYWFHWCLGCETDQWAEIRNPKSEISSGWVGCNSSFLIPHSLSATIPTHVRVESPLDRYSGRSA